MTDHIGKRIPSSSDSRFRPGSTRKYVFPPGGVTFSITTRPPTRTSSTLSCFCTGMRTAGSSASAIGGGASSDDGSCATAAVAAHMRINTATERIERFYLKVEQHLALGGRRLEAA